MRSPHAKGSALRKVRADKELSPAAARTDTACQVTDKDRRHWASIVGQKNWPPGGGQSCSKFRSRYYLQAPGRYLVLMPPVLQAHTEPPLSVSIRTFWPAM